MIHFKGIVEKEIGGKKFFFKFNMAALTLFGDLQGLTLRQLGLELQNVRLSTLANFFYAGAVTFCKQEKSEQTFSQDDAAEWIAELGIIESLRLLNEAFDVPEKNQVPPQETGAKTKQHSETSLVTQ
jgi:hypothetical protein